MCGIVGVASNGPMTVQMKEFFQSLLFHDIVRGAHATGVAAVDTLDRSLCVEKRALPADLFLQNEPAMENLFHTKHNFNIYIGHNRFATQGSKDADDNAHPFIHGDIVGVHNGTIRDQTLLDNHRDFVVDSDNLYYHMNKNGLDDTISKLDGAFSLVWYNKADNTLNFIRNDERPMAIGKLSNGCWVWASEIGMLSWLIRRHRTLAFATEKVEGADQVQLWQLDKGLHFSIQFKDKTRQMDKAHAAKKTFPVFTRNWDYGGYRTWDSRGNRATTHTYNKGKTDQDMAVAKWLPGGDTDSWLEVEFVGNIDPITTTGYVQKVSLFKYRNTAGQNIVLFAYRHNGNACSEWGADKIGERIYAQIGFANTVVPSTPVETVTPGFDRAFSLVNIKEVKPQAHYSYFDGEPVMKVDDKGNWSSLLGGNSSRVLPFQQPLSKKQKRQLRAAERRAASTNSGGRSERDATSDLLGDPGTDPAPTSIMVKLANVSITRSRLKDIFNESQGRCACCNERLGGVTVEKIYHLEWLDRSAKKNEQYLCCSLECFDTMEQLCGEYDEQWEEENGTI